MGQSVSCCIYFSPIRDTVHTMGLLRLMVIAKFAHPFLANFLTHTADKFLDLPFGLARNPLLRVRTSFYVASGEHRTLFHLRGRRITLCMLLQYGTSCIFVEARHLGNCANVFQASGCPFGETVLVNLAWQAQYVQCLIFLRQAHFFRDLNENCG